MGLIVICYNQCVIVGHQPVPASAHQGAYSSHDGGQDGGPIWLL